MMNKRFKINKHHSSYDKATEYALRSIYEDCIIKFDGQEFSYNKRTNELKIKDFNLISIYKPRFIDKFCNPFAELIRQEINTIQEEA